MSRLLTSMGEILIDFLPIEEDGALAGFRMHAGGAPFNVAVGMARLGQPAAFAGKVASDLFGRYLRARLEREGIDARFRSPATRRARWLSWRWKTASRATPSTAMARPIRS